MKVLLFGTGEFYYKYRVCFRRAEVIGLLDNNLTKQGTVIDGVTIYAPDVVRSIAYDQIYLLSVRSGEMRAQLLEMGVSEECIFEICDLYRGLGELVSAPDAKIYEPESGARAALPREADGCLTILTPNLNLNGAEVALCQLIGALRVLSLQPLVASLQDGDLREELSKLGVPVLILGSAAHEVPLSRQPVLHGACGFILNTIEMYLLLQKRDIMVPIVWWLHDSDMVYQETGIQDRLLRQIDITGIVICAVSPLAQTAFSTHYGQPVSISLLPYGLPDWAEEMHSCTVTESGVTFAVVGGMTRRKAQEDFLRAVRLLPQVMRQRCRFILVGAGDGAYFRKLQGLAQDLPEMEFRGELSRIEVLKFYSQELDVLVCPSVSDTLPIVTVEAMMFGHPIIVSDKVGTAALLTEYEAGIVIPVGEVERLAEAMLWLYEHPAERTRMGKEGRRGYEELFKPVRFQAGLGKKLQELQLLK